MISFWIRNGNDAWKIKIKDWIAVLQGPTSCYFQTLTTAKTALRRALRWIIKVLSQEAS